MVLGLFNAVYVVSLGFRVNIFKIRIEIYNGSILIALLLLLPDEFIASFNSLGFLILDTEEVPSLGNTEGLGDNLVEVHS